jgi:hypothetical protein
LANTILQPGNFIYLCPTTNTGRKSSKSRKHALHTTIKKLSWPFGTRLYAPSLPENGQEITPAPEEAFAQRTPAL